MVILKSPDEIAIMARAAAIVVRVLREIEALIRPGVRTEELDEFTEALILKEGGKPAFRGYRGFKASLCTSINEEVVHGIPGERRLNEGDIIGLDCGVLLEGYYGDAARTYQVGEVTDEAKKLIKVTQEALNKGLSQVVVGNRLYDISWAIQSHAEANGFSVVRDFVGHGIGRNLHEEPPIPNFGKPHTGIRLEEGLVLAIEPMINQGTYETELLSDGWTAVTKDRKLSAHFEDTVVVTKDGPKILTRV